MLPRCLVCPVVVVGPSQSSHRSPRASSSSQPLEPSSIKGEIRNPENDPRFLLYVIITSSLINTKNNSLSLGTICNKVCIQYQSLNLSHHYDAFICYYKIIDSFHCETTCICYDLRKHMTS